jgi:hypothetical protein
MAPLACHAFIAPIEPKQIGCDVSPPKSAFLKKLHCSVTKLNSYTAARNADAHQRWRRGCSVARLSPAFLSLIPAIFLGASYDDLI